MRRVGGHVTRQSLDAADCAGAGATTLLEDLFRTEKPRLSRALRRRISDPDDVADIVQDAFVRLADAKPADRLRSPRAYLQRIVRNLLCDRGKRAEHRFITRAHHTSLPEIAVPPDQGWALEAEDLMTSYSAAVAALSPRTREVFLLHRIDELRYRDIAERLGISVATVEYHMARAMAALDRALER